MAPSAHSGLSARARTIACIARTTRYRRPVNFIGVAPPHLTSSPHLTRLIAWHRLFRVRGKSCHPSSLAVSTTCQP
ncbi:hypothetical protein F01_420247 [Burkholderia cenocepacia]|nr:hypothetical protein F01_420247 [Burkholderia cenocepacia]